MRELKKIAILGAGVMGSQLALLGAEAGLDVKVRDIEEKFLKGGLDTIENQLSRRVKKGNLTEEGKKSLLNKIRFTLDLKEAVEDADYVIEAVPEKMDLKHQVLKEVYRWAPKHAILGTNTSSLLISDIAASIPQPERVIGVHFFNPPSTLKLLEIIYGDKTSEEAVKATNKLARLLGRETVYCLKDSPGFVPVRLFVLMINECAWAVELEGANIMEVDAALKYRLGLPLGMFELLDTLGGGSIELQHEVGSYLRSKLGETYRNPSIIEKKYESGAWGRRAGKDFMTGQKAGLTKFPLNWQGALIL